MDYLRQMLTGNELAAARSAIAEITAQMNIGEKQALLTGLQLGIAAYAQSENLEVAARIMAATLIAAHEVTGE